jgi:galactokinase
MHTRIMTGSDAAARLVELGLDPLDAAARKSLFDLVLAAFRETAGACDHVFWVPGRLEVFGKHTDYAGGRTLVAAVPRGFAFAVARTADSRIHVADAARSQDVSFDADFLDTASVEGPPTFSGWRNYVQTVVRRLTRNFPGAARGARLVFASDLPRASGMSSSSALMVGVAAALGRVWELDRRPEWRGSIRSALDAASYYACIENGMAFGALDGDSGVGTHGGSEDHAAMVTGRPGRLSAFAFVPMRRIDDVGVPAEWRFVLTPSGVAADKTGGAMGPYNNLARGADGLLRLWNASEPSMPSLAAALASGADAAARLRALASRATLPGWSSDALLKRLDHFIREDSRVPLALDGFRGRDEAALDHLSAQSQEDAALLLANQVPETVALAAAARGLGAFAASSFGAGFGGSLWALVHRDTARDFAARWHPEAFVAVPGPPLSEL